MIPIHKYPRVILSYASNALVRTPSAAEDTVHTSSAVGDTAQTPYIIEDNVQTSSAIEDIVRTIALKGSVTLTPGVNSHSILPAKGIVVVAIPRGCTYTAFTHLRTTSIHVPLLRI